MRLTHRRAAMRPSATDDWHTWVSDVRVSVLFTSEPRVSGQYKRWRGHERTVQSKERVDDNTPTLPTPLCVPAITMTFIVDDMSADNPPSAAALAAANACARVPEPGPLAYPLDCITGGNAESLHLHSHVCSVQHMSVSALFGALSLSD
jgi:hypothetical protein